jgi:hypothetical protein
MTEIIASRYYSVNSSLPVPVCSDLLSNSPMDVRGARRANMEAMVAELGSLKALAEKVETSDRTLSQIRNKTRNMGHDLARQFEEKLGKPEGWMDQTPSSRRPVVVAGGKVEVERQINPDILRESFVQLEMALHAERKVYPPELKARMLEAIYLDGVDKGRVDAGTVKTVLRLVS